MTRIGSSDLDVTPVALGSNVFGWTADEPTSHAILDAFVEQGGNLIDTADSYSTWVPGNHGGESETIIGSWLRASHRRDSVLIATKVAKLPGRPGLSAANVLAAADDSLRRLGTDRIDLYYAHQEDPDTPLGETVDAFAELVQQGKVRYVGVSNFSAPSIRRWVALAKERDVAAPVALQPPYNLVARRGFEQDLQETAQQLGLGVLPYYGLASGFLTGKYHGAADAQDAPRGAAVRQYLTDDGFALVGGLREIADAHQVQPASVALAWLIQRPAVVAPIASASKPEQVAPLLAAAQLTLSEDEVGKLDRLSKPFA